MSFIDPVCVPDIFACALAKAENLGGGNFRFTFVSTLDGETVVVARLIMNAAAVTPAILMAAEAVGVSMVREPDVEIRAH